LTISFTQGKKIYCANQQMNTDIMNRELNLSWTWQIYKMIFFLVSKSEHDNTDPTKTFLCANGESVFTYAEPLEYDWQQRGVTLGIVGFTTANSGRSDWGDAQGVFEAFADLGGPDLCHMASRCHKDKVVAKRLCHVIQNLSPQATEMFIQAQFDVLCRKGGYLYEAVHIIRELNIPVKPLLVAAIFDSLLNFGIGGKYCPIKFLRRRAKKGSKTKTLRRLLRWKRWVGHKNNHNSCKRNARNRSDQFKKLLKNKVWDLDESWCTKVVQWKMI
jgi:hypothetical protein